MKLKKLLAAVTAAALAVSTMAVSSFTASAADENVTFASTSGVNAKSVVVDYSLSSDKQNDWEYMYSNVNVIVKTWNNSASAGDWLENGMGGSKQEQYFTAPKKWVATYEGTAINSNFTVNLTAYDVLDALEVLYAPSDNYNFVINSVKAYSNADGAGDIVWQYPASSEDDNLPKNVWFKDESGNDAYICTNGNAPEKALFVDVEALLDEGKTLADVSKITAIYAVSSINEAEQGVSGCFGVVHDVGGTNDWYDDIYNEWEWLASDSTAEEGKDCVIECADGLLDTDECQFQIDTMKANNVLVVDFQIDYKDEGGDEPPVDDSKGDKFKKSGTHTFALNDKGEVNTLIHELLASSVTLAESDIVEFTVTGDNLPATANVGVMAYKEWDGWKGPWSEKGAFTVSGTVGDIVAANEFPLSELKALQFAANGFAAGDVVNYTITITSDKTENPDQPAEPTSKVLWEGTQATENWSGSVSSIAASEFANVKAGDKIAVTYTVPADGDGHQLSLKYQDSNWSGLPGFVAGDGGEWAAYNVSADGTYEHILTDADVAALKEYSIAVGGKYIVITKVELITSGGGSSDPEPPKPDDPKPDDPKPEDPKPDNTITTPSDRVTYPVVIPFGYTPATSEDITNAVSSTAEGDTASVNLTSNTRVDKAVLDTIAGKDITVEFKLKGGAKWVINGKNVEKAKKVDLGVRLRSKAIPAEKVSTVAGDNRTVQFSLRHNGDLGFTGALIIPFSSAYNGKFANLYYNNTAKDELEFVGSSKISAGQASFVFTHASDYVVVIDDEAYGEDVSSAAGVYETSEMTAAPYVAAVAVIAILGAAAVVIKKRFAK